jgi:hypothetical protein
MGVAWPESEILIYWLSGVMVAFLEIISVCGDVLK